MTREPPEWLNETFLSEALSNGGARSDVKVTSFTAKLAVAPGNNYTSHIWRVRVEYESHQPDSETSPSPKSVSLMVKAPVTKGIMSEMADKFDFFGKEPKVYNELLPLIKKKTGREFGPRCYPWPECAQESRGMILQDLKEEGYTMVDRQKQLDFEHCKIALTSLAEFHAASVACVHDRPSIATEVGSEVLYRGSGMLEQFSVWFKGILTLVTNQIASSEECKHAADYVRSRTDNLTESVVKIVNPEEYNFNVISHGDFWATNMMFKHNEAGEVVDIKFVDFQVVRYASPVVDLHYFIWSSANDDVRENRLDELFDVYLNTLNSNLESIGCTHRLDEDQFKNLLHRTSDFALLTICNLLPIVLSEAENVVDMEQFTEEDFKQDSPDEQWMKIYCGKTYSKVLPRAVRQFYKYYAS